MKNKMDEKINVRLPQIMGPVERWMGQCVPTDTYERIDESGLPDLQKKILQWARTFYSEHKQEEHLVVNRGPENVVVFICEYPNFEAYESVAFNLTLLESYLENKGEKKVRSYFRIPEPSHWETSDTLNLEKKGEENDE